MIVMAMFRCHWPTVHLEHIYGCLEYIRLFPGVTLHEFKNWWRVINVFGCTDLVLRPTGTIKYRDHMSISLWRPIKTSARAGQRSADLWLFLTVLIPMSICIIICLIKRKIVKYEYIVWILFAVAHIQMYFIRIDCLSGVINLNVYAFNK